MTGSRMALTTRGCGSRAAGCVSIDAADAALLHIHCTLYGTHEQSMPERDLPSGAAACATALLRNAPPRSRAMSDASSPEGTSAAG